MRYTGRERGEQRKGYIFLKKRDSERVGKRDRERGSPRKTG